MYIATVQCYLVLMPDCKVFHYCELVFSFTEEWFVSGMTDRVGVEDTECVQAFSLNTEPQFRSGLMVPAVDDGKDGTSTKTDQDNYHRQQVSSSDYGGVHYGNNGRSAMQECQLEGSREVRGVQEEIDYVNYEDDEKEQYEHLHMVENSDKEVAGSQVASNTGEQQYNSKDRCKDLEKVGLGVGEGCAGGEAEWVVGGVWVCVGRVRLRVGRCGGKELKEW